MSDVPADIRYVEQRNGVVKKRKTHCINGHEFDGTERWHRNWKGYQSRVCKICDRERMQRKRENPAFKAQEAAKARRYRERHPEKYRMAWEKQHEKKRQILLDARIGGCIVCGETHSACLDFHHRNGKTDKLGDIGRIRRFSTERLLAEIAKCDVLCANCHRKHHWDERQQQLTISEGD